MGNNRESESKWESEKKSDVIGRTKKSERDAKKWKGIEKLKRAIIEKIVRDKERKWQFYVHYFPKSKTSLKSGAKKSELSEMGSKEERRTDTEDSPTSNWTQRMAEGQDE